jgi:hypothetical protein
MDKAWHYDSSLDKIRESLSADDKDTRVVRLLFDHLRNVYDSLCIIDDIWFSKTSKSKTKEKLFTLITDLQIAMSFLGNDTIPLSNRCAVAGTYLNEQNITHKDFDLCFKPGPKDESTTKEKILGEKEKCNDSLEKIFGFMELCK